MSKANEHKPGYKHTHLGWIPEEWETVHLKDLVDPTRTIRYGIVQPGNFSTAGRYMVRGQDYSFGWVKPDNLFKVSDEIESRYKNARLKAGDLIITIVGAGTGTVEVVPEWLEGANITQTTARIAIQKGKACPHFCFQFLRSHLGQKLTYQNIKGGAQPGLNCGDIEYYLLPAPSLKEQRKIAAILSTWDEAITQTQQLIAQLQQRNKGLMQQLLKPKDDWSEKRMSEIFERVVRKNTNGNTNVITISAQRGFVKQNDFFKKLVASETLDNYFLVRKGEFCYNKSYSNGYDWGATKRLNDFDEAVVTTLYICFRIKNEIEYSGDYFEYYFDANVLDRGLAKIAHEGGRAHGLLNVTPSNFFSLKIHVPSFDEQIRIFKILSAAKNELRLTEQKLAALQQQKKGLMQKLLTGEVRVRIDNNQN